MGYAQDMDSQLLAVDERVARTAAPLQGGVGELSDKINDLSKAVEQLGANQDKLAGDLGEATALLLVACKKLGFDPQSGNRK